MSAYENNSRLIRVALALLISLGLAYHGHRRKSLNTSGCLAAVFVGFSTFSCGYRFGLILILFYYTSSKITKVDEEKKKKLEFDYQPGGLRNWVQVFANSIVATIFAILYIYYFSDSEFSLTDIISNYKSGSRDYLDIFGLISLPKASVHIHLTCMYVAHYACASADTWASELGVLSKSPPILITTFSRVPAGTNGGISLLGTIASGLGGAFIGFLYATYDLLLLSPSDHSLSQLKISCMMVLFGLISGVLGSLIDSLLGATLQASYFSKTNNCIVRTKKECKKIEDLGNIELICGIDVLSNEAVNVISIVITCIVMIPLTPHIFFL